jgi:hypothetical protein
MNFPPKFPDGLHAIPARHDGDADASEMDKEDARRWATYLATRVAIPQEEAMAYLDALAKNE